MLLCFYVLMYVVLICIDKHWLKQFGLALVSKDSKSNLFHICLKPTEHTVEVTVQST